MKKIIFFLILLVIGASCTGPCQSSVALPFAGTTKHKPVKRLKAKEVREIVAGKNMYYSHNGKVKRNR